MPTWCNTVILLIYSYQQNHLVVLSWHFKLFHEEDARSNNPQVSTSTWFYYKNSYPLHTTTTNGFFFPITWIAGQCFFQFCEHSFSCLWIGLLSLLSSMICMSSKSSQAISFASSGCLVSTNCVIKDCKYIFTNTFSVNFLMTVGKVLR